MTLRDKLEELHNLYPIYNERKWTWAIWTEEKKMNIFTKKILAEFLLKEYGIKHSVHFNRKSVWYDDLKTSVLKTRNKETRDLLFKICIKDNLRIFYCSGSSITVDFYDFDYTLNYITWTTI